MRNKVSLMTNPRRHLLSLSFPMHVCVRVYVCVRVGEVDLARAISASMQDKQLHQAMEHSREEALLQQARFEEEMEEAMLLSLMDD